MKITEFTLLKNTEEHIYATVKQSYFFGLFSRTFTIANTRTKYGLLGGEGWFYLNTGENIRPDGIWPAIRAYKAQAALAATAPKEES